MIFPKMVKIYEKYGFQVRTGLNPYRFYNYRDASSTVIFKNNEILGIGGNGVSLEETYFFECLFEKYSPDNIFIIGNGYGWSTVLLALLNPGAKVVAIDSGLIGSSNEDEGIIATNSILKNEKLNAVVCKGFSPNNVPEIVKKEFDSKIDFVFIDGGHTNEQQTLDFEIIQQFCGENVVYVFHDVLNFNLIESLDYLSSKYKLNSKILNRTDSGIGILFSNHIDQNVKECLEIFDEDPEMMRILRSYLVKSRKIEMIKRILTPGLFNLLIKIKNFITK